MPEFPAEMKGQLIYAATLIVLAIGLLLVILPRQYARLIGLVERPGRHGAIGEVRASGGFLAGLALAVFLFQDQPELPLSLGVALGVAAFGRILALMSDQASSLANFVLLLIQLALAACLMTPLFDVWTPDSVLSMPQDAAAQMTFMASAVLAGLGIIVMFAPRIALAVSGLLASDVSETALGGVRAFGGFALGTAAMVMIDGSIMLYLAFGVALAAGVAGRLLAIAADRGNYLFQIVALLANAGLAFVPLNHVLGMM